MKSALWILALAAVAAVAIPFGLNRSSLGQAASAPAATAVPAPEDFTWKAVSCSDSGAITNVVLRVHDTYPGPLVITYRLDATPPGQPVFGTLKVGDTDILAAGTASAQTLTVQVQNGEGAVAILTMKQAEWIGLCPTTPRAPVTGTGG